MQNVTTHVLNQVILFSPQINCWTARRKLHRDDILVDASKLPPQSLASLGSKWICNPKRVMVFQTIRSAVHRACLEVGVKFLGGYAVPEDLAEELAKRLEAFGVQFNQERTAFLDDYDVEVENHIAAHPDWASQIRRAITPRQRVEKRLKFDWTAFRIAEVPAADEPGTDSTLRSSLSSSLSGLSGQLWGEIAAMSEEVLKCFFQANGLRREEATQKLLRPIRAIRGKLQGFVFLDSRISPLVNAFDEALARLPSKGVIAGPQLLALYQFIESLADYDRLMKTVDLLSSGCEFDDVLDPGAQGPAPAVIESQSEPVILPVWDAEIEQGFIEDDSSADGWQIAA